MTVTVVVPTTMSSDGTVHTYTDDSNPDTGLDGGGHVTRLLPLILDNLSIANYAVNQIAAIPAQVAGSLDTQITLCNGYATSADASAVSANQAEATVLNTAANIGSMLGINFGAFQVTDGELSVTHISTSIPSLLNGDLILTYESL